MDELVLRLSEGEHRVIASRADRAIDTFRESIERGYVFIKFTETQGGTELGVRIIDSETKLDDADFNQAKGTVHLVGQLTLNYVKVRCIADIDLASLEGYGHLEPSTD